MQLLFAIVSTLMILAGLAVSVFLLAAGQIVAGANFFCSTMLFGALVLLHDSVMDIRRIAMKHLPTMAADLHEVGEAHRVAKAQAEHARREWERQQQAAMNSPPIQPPKLSRV